MQQQRLPNLGMLDLRPRASTGAPGDGNQPDPKRQKTATSTLSDEQRDVHVENFIAQKMMEYFGHMPSDQEAADFRQRVVQAIYERYQQQGLTMDWPSELGLTQGKQWFAGKRETNQNIRRLREKLWTEGIFILKDERDEARKERDVQKRDRILEDQLRYQDASSDGAQFFNDKEPVRPKPLAPNTPLSRDIQKKVSGDDQKNWGEEARAQAAAQARGRGGCCGRRS